MRYRATNMGQSEEEKPPTLKIEESVDYNFSETLHDCHFI